MSEKPITVKYVKGSSCMLTMKKNMDLECEKDVELLPSGAGRPWNTSQRRLLSDDVKQSGQPGHDSWDEPV